MDSDPYFERLSEAYAVVDGIPAQQITLDIEHVSIAPGVLSIGMNEGCYIAPDDWDSLVLTPDIWLSLCPPYIDIVWPLVENWEGYGVEAFWRIEGRMTSRFEIAMGYLFNLPDEAAEELFGMRGDDEMDDRSDKQVLLDRITAFLQKNGQEVTIGTGHVAEDEMLEHGISRSKQAEADPAEVQPAEMQSQAGETADGAAGMQTGFAALAAEGDTPSAETFDTEASAAAVIPIDDAQVVGQEPGQEEEPVTRLH